MKKIVLSLAVLLLFGGTASTQAHHDSPAVPVRIADLLAQFPAKDSVQLSAHMKALAELGEKGLAALAASLPSSGKGDPSRLEYALNSFSYAATQPGKEGWRRVAERAYIQALETAATPENKAFLMSQLQIVGVQEATVAALEQYLANERLCDPAARALVAINSPGAGRALVEAAQNAQGNCLLSIVAALGDSRVEAAEPVLATLVNGEEKVRKLALQALAQIARPSSAPLLEKAAAQSGFSYEKTGATGAYLLYIDRLAKEGNRDQAMELSRNLLRQASQANQVHTRIAALSLLVRMQGPKSMSLLTAAAGDKDPEYRAAALQLAAPYLDPSTTGQWIKKLKKSDPQTKAAIITLLGEQRETTALPVLLNALKDKNAQVRLAAIPAAGRTGGEQVLNHLLQVMRSGSGEEIAAVKAALERIKGDQVVQQAAEALPAMPPGAQVALIGLLQGRAAADKANVVFPLVKSSDTAVRAAGLAALEQLATKNDLPQLFSLLREMSGPHEIGAAQRAVVAALGDLSDPAQRSDLILTEMAQAAPGQKPLFFHILAGTGGDKALREIAGAFAGGDAAAKKAAVQALAAWSDSSASSELYNIALQTANSEYRDPALKGFIQSVNNAQEPDARKLLSLRKAMDLATTVEQKRLVLEAVTGIKTFPALVFAGRFLDDKAVQQPAAQAVMNIALSGKQFYGNTVRELLNKTIQVLQGTDSDYQKEAVRKFLSEMPGGEGFVPLFNGRDLSGWKGLAANPIARAKMDAKTLAREQQKADEVMRKGWYAKGGELNFSGEGDNLCTEKKYGDFELLVDWKITKGGDAGIYLRGTPQVQIWDTARRDVGAQVGSGGLYNNETHPSTPRKLADNAIGDWNHFHILMKGDRVTVRLNGELVVDNVVLENYWDRNLPLFAEEQIELQAHGTHVAYRDIYIREIPRPQPFALSAEEKKEGFQVLFDGTHMHHWRGNTESYVIEDGNMVVRPEQGSGGNLYTKEEYGDFVFRFEFQLTPGANNGLGIRAPLEGDAAYVGMEVQILDDGAEVYKNLQPYQYHGSVYGVLPAKRGYLKPVGEWNYQEVVVKGSKVKVTLNGTVITEGDIKEASKNGTMDGKEHPGLKRTKGHIGFLGHGSVVRFRNIRVRSLPGK